MDERRVRGRLTARLLCRTDYTASSPPYARHARNDAGACACACAAGGLCARIVPTPYRSTSMERNSRRAHRAGSQRCPSPSHRINAGHHPPAGKPNGLDTHHAPARPPDPTAPPAASRRHCHDAGDQPGRVRHAPLVESPRGRPARAGECRDGADTDSSRRHPADGSPRQAPTHTSRPPQHGCAVMTPGAPFHDVCEARSLSSITSSTTDNMWAFTHARTTRINAQRRNFRTGMPQANGYACVTTGKALSCRRSGKECTTPRRRKIFGRRERKVHAIRF